MYSILYVDDEESLLEIGRIFLERDKTMAVETCTSAQAALDRIAAAQFDAVISDYHMPGMDGIDFLKAVRSRFSDLPFILFTGRGREEVVVQAINNGVDFYLQKGGDPGSQFAELAHKVRMAIERRRANLALQREIIFNQAIFNSVPGILYLYNNEGRLVRWNRNHEILTGFSSADLAGKYVLDWFPDEKDKQTIRAGIEATMQGGQASAEANLMVRSGETVPFFFTACRLEVGGQIYFTGIGIDISGKRKAEAALHASEEKFRGISERSSDLIYVEDANGVITYVSPSVMAILGYTPEEVIGLHGDRFVADDDVQKAQSGREVRRQGQTFRNFPLRIKRRDGTYAVLDIQAIPIVRNGEFLGMQMIGRDVSVRRSEELALEESEELYRTLADSLPDYVIVHRNGTILYANRLAAEITGIPRENLVGRSIFDFIALESRQTVLEKMQQRTQGEPTGWYEVVIQAREGRTGTALVSSTEIPYHGSPAVLIVMSEITTYKQLEASLRESEERFRVLTEHSLDAIVLFSRDLRHLYVNPSVGRVLGIAPEELIGKTHREMAFPDQLIRLWEGALRSVFETGTPGNVQFQLPDGTWVDWLLVPVHDTGGAVDQVLASARVITKLKLVEETLRRANRQIGLLNAITRHDIINQLAIIQSYITLALQKQPGTEMEAFLGRLKSAAETIREQIEFTRVYEDVGSREPQWQDLPAVLAHQPVPAGITLINDLPAVEIFADPMLCKVFHNLLDNAVRHGGHASTVRTFAEETPDEFRIIVADDGTGISDGEKATVFDRGYGKHTGHGLFLVREILAITGITIREAGTHGAGARFEIVVPKEACRPKKRGV